MPSNGPLVQLKDVRKQFNAASGAGTLTVLDGISLEVSAGESAAVVGPSGSGKSTLLQIIGTLDQPTSGEVLLEGQDVGRLNAQTVALIRNRLIGFVFQAHYLLPQCTVMENVLVPTLASPRSQRREEMDSDDVANSKKTRLLTSAATETPENRARRLLERVGLGGRLDHFPGQLSGGESQRVAVVRALINSPRLLLADEPTGSLDHAAALALTQLLAEMNKEEKVTLIVVTHSQELAKQMRRVLELQDGRWRGG